jgi:hypothetical protein
MTFKENRDAFQNYSLFRSIAYYSTRLLIKALIYFIAVIAQGLVLIFAQ